MKHVVGKRLCWALYLDGSLLYSQLPCFQDGIWQLSFPGADQKCNECSGYGPPRWPDPVHPAFPSRVRFFLCSHSFCSLVRSEYSNTANFSEIQFVPMQAGLRKRKSSLWFVNSIEDYVKLVSLAAPESVSNIRVAIQTNSTAMITWTPSADPENILTYAVTYQAFLGPCNKDPTTVYLGAPSTSYEMPLPRNDHCEFMLRITNYDAIGMSALPIYFSIFTNLVVNLNCVT